MNKENVITLDNPVKRGEQVIEQVTLMKPSAGTLRGVSLAAVANSEVDALIKVLPRMTAPLLTEQEQAVYRRGRNGGAHPPKNADPGHYAKATGLEALFGYLYLNGEQERARELFEAITANKENARLN